MAAIDKNRPSEEWIAEMRRRFPCEAEIDRVLTHKLQRRAGPGYSPVSLETLCKGIEAQLKDKLDDRFEILEPKWLNGGASKVQMAFKLRWTQPGVGATVTRLVLRMEPAESIVETSRLREFQLIKAMEGVVPVPPVFWADPQAKYFPYPAIIYGFADGVAKPTGSVSNVTGLGINFGPRLRPILGPQFVDHLAKIHLADWTKADLSAFDIPALGTQAVEWHLNWWDRVWEEDFNEDVPLLRFTAAWLRANMPPIDRLSIIHGDYRAGNFLYTEHDNQITAWLDWELGHLGDYHEDVAYAIKDSSGHYAEDGKTFLVNGLMTADEFVEQYEKASGLPIDMKAVRYYDVVQAYKSCVIVLGTGYRAVRGGKTHQDIVLQWLSGVGYPILEELRQLLEEVA
ncbi:phosphotransferase family protein [Aromatoleum toluclasticum]|uniref:phosphotransferase family protein n=1 Tax=Aromatoleum toluclasticum TaxID=92003 RepID=UPI00037ABA78|nr:phosphotransferase family protein [Aromatoleum toluclasticum]